MLSAQTLTKNEVSTQTVPLNVSVRGSTQKTQVQAFAPFNANTLQIAIELFTFIGQKSCGVSAAPASVEAARAPGGLVFLLPSRCVYTLHRGIYSVQEEKQQREFPVGPPPPPPPLVHTPIHSQS